MAFLRVQFHLPGINHAGGVAPIAGVPAAGSQTLSILPDVTTDSDEITVPAGGPWAIKLRAIGNDCWYAIGDAPNPAAEPRGYLADGEVDWIHAEAGQKIACVEATLAEGVTA